MEPSLELRLLDSPDDWTLAFDIMKQLRPHLESVHAFSAQVRRQREQGYRLLAACDGQSMLGLAGFRFQTNTLYGNFVYIDDLIVTEHQQRTGIGARLLDGVRRIAQEAHCAHLVLDTGLHMALAQRFYYRNGLLGKGMHFVEALTSERSDTR
jgi:ribosomal protein S18 acetylase RimI-like enzyme